MLVLLVAADLGFAGEHPPASGARQGMWHEQYLSNGIEKRYQYGCYRGNRCRSLPSVLRVRRQAYWSTLSGACGHLYGSAAWTVQPDVWRKWLGSPGAQYMSHFGRFFQSQDWSPLVPDEKHVVLAGGLGEAGSTGYAACVWTLDGRLAVCYLPSARTVTVDLGRLKGPVQTRWFDPTSGPYSEMAGSPFAASGPRGFASPALNAAGEGDMVLIPRRAGQQSHSP